MTQFRGQFDCKLDAKGRLSLPSTLRSRFEKSSEYVITNSLYKGRRCLDLYPLKVWHALEKQIGKLSPLKSEVQAYQRFYLSGGQEGAIDGQGRLVLPASLRKFAGIEESSQLVLVGLGNKVEIWSGAAWSELYEGLAQDFENIQAAVSQVMGDE